jgi:membrane-associated phospholipid phosphatase
VTFLTDFGDSAVLLPLSAVMLVWLLAAQRYRTAMWWAGALALLGILTGGLKVMFAACPPTRALNSPSGHTGFSMLVYGALALLIASNRRTLGRALILLTAITFAAAIAISRVILGMHSIPETILGLAIGSACLALFAVGYDRREQRSGSLVALAVIVALTVGLLHGHRLNFEHDMRGIGDWIGLRQLLCR